VCGPSGELQARDNDHLTTWNGGELEVTLPRRLTEQKTKTLL
jgi:hypothetical protein